MIEERGKHDQSPMPRPRPRPNAENLVASIPNGILQAANISSFYRRDFYDS